jgi:transposase-like protein
MCYLCRAVDRDGGLIDTMLSKARDMAAAKRFIRSAKATMGTNRREIRQNRDVDRPSA